ncbi:MAG: NifB/NifX family molybdenum-iron cluster-binding protein [Dehalococcoidia bacterium]|nr:NifB/NifX family molybdenum-iron cluster-binding protein [Dehalococcoidia bacterium]
MRYAVPVTDGRLAAHFGHCQQFAIFDADEANKTIQKKEIIASPGHEPGLLPMWLAEHGVSAVIAGGMGSRAQSLFRENHIRVIIGATESDPEEAVLQYLSGTLATGDNICDH